jgi:hypothetical protein
MTTVKEDFARVVYSKPENELKLAEKAVRADLDAALKTFNQALDRFHKETPSNDGLLEIELYPCDDDCEHCKADAA